MSSPDEDETPVGENRNIGLKPSILTYGTTSTAGDGEFTHPSQVKGNVVIMAQGSDHLLEVFPTAASGGQDTLDLDDCDVFEEDAMTHATVFRETDKTGLLTRCNKTQAVVAKPRKKPLPSQYKNMPVATRLFQPAQ